MVESTEEMRVALALVIVLLAAGTALAYTNGGVAAGVTLVARAAPALSEPVAMLLSGSLLLALGGAVRRLTW